MMEKAIKQRLLGGLVLVAGAALFLPVLLDGSGAGLTIPPMPKAPEVAGVEALAPRLDQKVAETEKAVDAAHAGRDEAASGAGNAAPAGDGDVAPDSAALAANEGHAAPATAAVAPARPAATAAAPATAATAVIKTPAPAPAAKPAPAAVAPAKPATAVAAVAAAPQPAALAPAKPAPVSVPAKPVAASTPAPAPAKPVAASPAPAAAKAAAPATTSSKPADAKDAAKPAAEKPLPGAWLVQVGVFSSRDKAQALVQQLRHKGYSAVLNPQGGSFKVVVGPELNRSVADSIKARLAADPELKLNGWVQAYKP